VYRNNVVVGLTEALVVGFPALRRQVGDEEFRALAQAFLRAHPPATPLLMFYGAALPDFMARARPLAGRPWLADLARLDQALRESYHAADATPVDAAALAALPPERLLAARFCLAPALRLLSSPWAIHDLWSAEGPLTPLARLTDILILRPGFDPVPHPLPTGGGAFVAALRDRKTLAGAMDAAGPEHPLTETWTLLLTGGALTAIEETAA
jgi:hypothetical protein